MITRQAQTDGQAPDSRSDGPARDASPASPARNVVLRRFIGVAVAVVVALGTLGLALGVAFVSGIIPLSGFEGRIEAALGERFGNDWAIQIDHAEIARAQGKPQLVARDVTFLHSGGASFRAPEAVLGYEPLALLRGALKLNSIEIRGLKVRAGIDKDGSIIFDSDAHALKLPASAAPEKPPEGEPDQALPRNVAAALLTIVDALADEGGPLARLDNVAVTRANLTLIDPAGQERIGLENVELDLKRDGPGAALITLREGLGASRKDIQAETRIAESGEREINLTVRQMLLSDAMIFATGTRHVAVRGLPVSGHVRLAGATPETAIAKADLRFGKGELKIQDSELEPLILDSVHVMAETGTGLSSARFSMIDIIAGTTRLNGSAEAGIGAGPALRMQGNLAGQIRGAGKDAPVPISALRFDLNINPAEILLNELTMDGPGLAVTLQGAAQAAEGGYHQKIEIKAAKTDARQFLAVWPAHVAPLTRQVVSERIIGGTVESMTLTSTLTPSMQKALREGEPLPDSAVDMALTTTDIRMTPAEGFPVLAIPRAFASATGRGFSAKAAMAKMEIEGGEPLALAEGTFAIADTWAERPVGRSAFKISGEAASLLAFLSIPALRESLPLKPDGEGLRGIADLKVNLALPLTSDVKASEIALQISGGLTGIASDRILGSEKLDATNLTVSYDKSALIMKGEGRIGGDKGQIEIRQPAKGVGEASFSAVLDQAARQRRGLGFDGQVSGPVGLKVTKALAGAKSDLRAEVDLSRAAIDGLLPGWVKPAGRPGRMSFTLTDPDGNGPDLGDFILDASPVLARGSVSLDKKNAFESASFSTFRLSPGDDLKVEAALDGNLLKLVIRGAVADARPFLKDASGAPGPVRSGKKAAGGPDLDVDFAVPILTGFNAEVIGNAALKWSRRGKDVKQFNLDGKIGKSPVNAKLTRLPDGGGLITITAADGGAFMRYMDLYRRAYGGELILTVTPDVERQSGEILLRDFTVRNEPALQRVVAEQGNDANGGAVRLNVAEVEFTKLRAEFSRSPTRLDIKDAVLWGQQLGFTLQGNVDYGKDRIDIVGSYVPGYAFNNAFSQVPIVGGILGGGRNEGLFAVNFRLNGAASAPTMTVNPLSALAPGILRRFVDPFGGSLQGSQPAPKPGANQPIRRD